MTDTFDTLFVDLMGTVIGIHSSLIDIVMGTPIDILDSHRACNIFMGGPIVNYTTPERLIKTAEECN